MLVNVTSRLSDRRRPVVKQKMKQMELLGLKEEVV